MVETHNKIYACYFIVPKDSPKFENSVIEFDDDEPSRPHLEIYFTKEDAEKAIAGLVEIEPDLEGELIVKAAGIYVISIFSL